MKRSIFYDITPYNPLKLIDVSHEYVISIFRNEKRAKQENSEKQVEGRPEDRGDLFLRNGTHHCISYPLISYHLCGTLPVRLTNCLLITEESISCKKSCRPPVYKSDE
jgi:hypothetical protein